MKKSMIELVVGNLDDKRAYRELMKQVNQLPKEYSFTFKQIQKYMYNFDTLTYGIEVFQDLLDLFEMSAADHKKVEEIVGKDVAVFCDEWMASFTINTKSLREKLNKEIQDYFHKENNHDESN